MTLTVVCGPDHLIYWREFTIRPSPRRDERVDLLGFVRDVRPLYVESQPGASCPPPSRPAPTSRCWRPWRWSAPWFRPRRAAPAWGCLHGHSVWMADTPEAFAAGIATLIVDPERRAQIAQAAYGHAVRNFDWEAIGDKQRALFRVPPVVPDSDVGH